MNTVFLPDEAASLAYAAEFARYLSAPLSVYLNGDLGSGKTCFTRGVLRALGYQGSVKSPTYALVESYTLQSFQLHHFDLYRIADPEELDYIGLDYYFTQDAVVFIEWPARGQGILPNADIELSFSYHNQGRDLQLQAHSEAGKKLLAQLISD